MTSNMYTTDGELFDLMRRELFSCVIGDIMDKIGLFHQFLPPDLKPLTPEMIIAGRAMPVIEADFFAESFEGRGPLGRQPFGLMFDALDDLKPNEIYVASGTVGAYAMWGEIMSIRASKLGAGGAIVNGYSRDTRGIIKLDFPTFSRGAYGQDQGVRGKIVDYRVPIEIGGVRIEPGTLLFGDIDGVVAIPKHAEREVIKLAYEKVTGEHVVAEKIRAGMSAREAFEKYKIM